MPDLSIKTNQSGFAALYLTLLILTASLTLTASIFVLTFTQQKDVQNTVKSSQSYYLAEAGIEDALLKLKNNPSQAGFSSNFSIGQNSASTTVSDIIGGSRTITSEGSVKERVRKIQVVYSSSAEGTDFFYGAQVGAGGIELKNLSGISGNVFSNGNIIAESGTEITGTVQVSGPGNKIDGAIIGGDAYVNVCDDSDIAGTLYAAVQSGCSFNSFIATSSYPLPVSLPITAQNIAQWKSQAEAGGIINGNQNFSGGSNSLGPVKIVGNLTIQDSAEIIVNGTIWVTGNIIVKNEAKVHLSSSYGFLSGMIINDGTVTLENNSISSGSGQSGSYLMYLSTSSANPALTVKNNARANIIYTSSGWLQVENNANLREITGYGIRLENNVRIVYEVGLQSAFFTSGPGGSWKVESWQEVE